MSTPTQKWFDLRDRQTGAKLKLRKVNGNIFLFVVGMSRNSPRWTQAVERLGFQSLPNQKFLIRMVQPDERIKLSWLHQVWPDAVNAQMTLDQIGLQVSTGKSQRSGAPGEREENRDIAVELERARLLGRNHEGDEVYEGGTGRFVYRQGRGITPEVEGVLSPLFLRARDDKDFALCAEGMVRSMDLGQAQRTEEMLRLVQAVTGQDEPSTDALDRMASAVDAAVLAHLARRYDTAQDAFGDAARLYEYLPPFLGKPRGGGAMPVPLSVVAQRLLGDTAGQVVVYPNAFDGAAFAFLPGQTKVRAYRNGKDLSRHAVVGERKVEWLDEFSPAREVGADALFFNADPSETVDGARRDFLDALNSLRALKPSGRAVLVLAGDDPLHPGRLSARSGQFLDAVYSRYDVEEAFEIGAEMTQRVGTGRTLRVISLRNVPPRPGSVAPVSLPVAHSWDEVKSRVDEAIVRAQVREAESEGVDVTEVASENVFQSPYIAFSRVGEARTMVPRNLQGPLQAALSDVESRFGPVDRFVEQELGFGENTLGDRLSPEQVDAIALILARFKSGRGAILADETGIGKGRTLATLATWANKRGKNVVFITDRANLFSDLARDLRDIGEWGRFRPLVTNSDGAIVDTIGDAGVLFQSEGAEQMRRILEDNKSLAELDRNIIFTTYSQVFSEGSEKAPWIKNQLADALLIVDEAHLAAGSDSNVAVQISEMTQIAGDVIYSSATWAKTPRNLHIYARAFPETVNVSSLTQAMKSGGEAFSEVFSSMLARDGALIRREHDLSKLEFRVEIDEVNAERNNEVADRIAEVMGQISYVAGNLDKLMIRMSQIQLDALRAARDARGQMLKVNIFKSGFGTGSMLYQVQRRMNAALNVDNAVRLALQAVESGFKPGIIFEDTGESFVNDLIEEGAEILADGTRVPPSAVRMPTLRDLMRKIVRDLTLVRVAEVDQEVLSDIEGGAAVELAGQGEGTAAEDDGVVIADLVAAAPAEQAGETQRNADAREVEQDARADDADEAPPPRKRARRKLSYTKVPFDQIPSVSEEQRRDIAEGMKAIAELIDSLPELPISVPDVITARLVAAGLRVGEISGRKYQLRPLEGDAGMAQLVRRPKKKSFVTATTRAYNAGDLDVVLINRSAATGISLHASPRFADRRRRYVIEMQIPEDPTNRIQLYGRFNRFDQESFPIIANASTGIYGEVRQLMLQNRKLFQMSANVRSSRDNFAEIKDIPDLLSTLGREVCQQYLSDNPAIASRMGVDMSRLEEGKVDAAQMLTQRVSLLRVREQKLVYEQVTAMFDDALMRADLAGENPFKPKEFDWRAEVVRDQVVFGMDLPGLTSAFDGAVHAKVLTFTEQLIPKTWADVRQMVRAARERLVAGGRALALELPADAPEGDMPGIDLSPLVEATTRQLGALAVTALAATEFANVDAALASQSPNPVRRGMARKMWAQARLGRMVPGARIALPHPVDERYQRHAVIVDLVPPPPKKESQLALWKVVTLAPGERDPISYSLSTLLEGVSLQRLGEGGGSDGSGVAANIVVGEDLMSTAGLSQHARGAVLTIRDRFDNASRGERRRVVTVLDGNMYLASEFAAEAKIGSGIIYTDERGQRHRGILVRQDFNRHFMMGMPVRLWLQPMMVSFLTKVRAAVGDAELPRLRMFTSFRGAARWMSQNSAEEDLMVFTGDTIGLHVEKGSRKRLTSMLRSAQKKIRQSIYGKDAPRAAEDPGYVQVSEKGLRNGGGSGVIALSCSTPEKLERAVRMLCQGAGMQIYVTSPNSPAGQLAKQCMRDYFIGRAGAQATDGAGREIVEAALQALQEQDERAQAADLGHLPIDTADLFYGAELVQQEDDLDDAEDARAEVGEAEADGLEERQRPRQAA